MNVNEYHAIRTRRSFLDKSLYGLGLGVLSHLLGIEGRTAPTNSLLQQEPHFKPRAKNIIFLFQAGAPSQIDLFDPKPELHKWNGSPLPDSLARNLDLAFIQPTAKVLASRRKFHPAGNSALNFQSGCLTQHPLQTRFALFVPCTVIQSTTIWPNWPAATCRTAASRCTT